MIHPLIIRDEPGRRKALEAIANLDLKRPWKVEIKRHVKRRTTSQNALYWAWVNEVAEHVSEHTGMDRDEIHEFFKQKFLKPKVVVVNGEAVSYWTTTDKTTTDMQDYMDKIYAWATTELGLVLPTPTGAGGDFGAGVFQPDGPAAPPPDQGSER